MRNKKKHRLERVKSKLKKWMHDGKKHKQTNKPAKTKHLIVVVHSPFVCWTAANSNFKPTFIDLFSQLSDRFIYSFVSGLAFGSFNGKEVFICKWCRIFQWIFKSNGNERKISHSFRFIWLMCTVNCSYTEQLCKSSPITTLRPLNQIVIIINEFAIFPRHLIFLCLIFLCCHARVLGSIVDCCIMQELILSGTSTRRTI